MKDGMAGRIMRPCQEAHVGTTKGPRPSVQTPPLF